MATEEKKDQTDASAQAGEAPAEPEKDSAQPEKAEAKPESGSDKPSEGSDKPSKAESAPEAEKESKAEKEPKAEKKSKGGKEPKAEKKPKGGKESKGEKKGGKKSKDGKKKSSAVALPKGYVPRLLVKYREEIAPALFQTFGYKNKFQVPRLEKIVLNMGVGEGGRDIKILDAAVEELTLIAGQRPKITRATRAVAQFKTRIGMPIGCAVTLRGWRMYDFLDRLVNVAIPRMRDFRGLPQNSFDGRGNHGMGIQEHLIFMELDYDKVTATRGLNICTVTTASTDAECRELLKLFGMPFRKD